jgi:hypothetical protein
MGEQLAKARKHQPPTGMMIHDYTNTSTLLYEYDHTVFPAIKQQAESNRTSLRVVQIIANCKLA